MSNEIDKTEEDEILEAIMEALDALDLPEQFKV